MSQQFLMTEDEVHDFGLQIVKDYLPKDGYTIVTVTYDRHIDPQVVARKEGELYHILVRSAIFPNKGKLESREKGYQALREAADHRARCYFASIGFGNAFGHSNLEMAIPIRGSAYYVAYEGIKALTPEWIEAMVSEQESNVYNQYGQVAGYVISQPDERYLLEFLENADASTLMMSLGAVFAGDSKNGLTRQQQALFSRWANLPEDEWTQRHRDFFAFVLMHFLMEVKTCGGNLPHNIMQAVRDLPPLELPALPYALNDAVREIYAVMLAR